MMSARGALLDLPLVVDGYELECLAADTPRGWCRQTTVLRLRGGGREGLGEEVNYSERDQQRFLEQGSTLQLRGTYTLRSFSARLGELDLGPVGPEAPGGDRCRRWAFESAGLDLALRQAGTDLFTLLEVGPRPIRFVASSTLAGDEDMGRARRLLQAHPGLGLNIDATRAPTDEMLDELADSRRVEVVDFNGAGAEAAAAPDPKLYARVLERLPDVLIEDPHHEEEILELLRPHRERVAWDAPIHGIDAIEALPWEPAWINIKPSRFGSLEKLLETYEYCGEHGISTYGGGQLELGPGRGQLQLLASIFHADAPNDVAPRDYNVPSCDPAKLEGSPLPAPAASTGFSRAFPS